MITEDQMNGIVSALQEDCKDLPPCGHAACIVLDVVGITDDAHDLDDTQTHFLQWLDVEMQGVIEICAATSRLPHKDAEAVIKSELAVWWTKGVMMGKKLARVDETP